MPTSRSIAVASANTAMPASYNLLCKTVVRASERTEGRDTVDIFKVGRIIRCLLTDECSEVVVGSQPLPTSNFLATAVTHQSSFFA